MTSRSRGSSGGGRKVAFRRRILLGCWLLACLALLARAVQVQVVQGEVWQEAAERQHRRSVEIPAPRGPILDRDGTPLAVSHERLRVAVAPREVSDVDTAADALSRALDMDAGSARRIAVSSDPWVVLPGSHPPAIREHLEGVPGIHLERQMERVLPHGELALGVLGRVRELQGAGGIEQSYDTVLAGRPGREVQARDNLGRPIPGESITVMQPRQGGQVVLTLDLDLQEIGREALADAIRETGAVGGDLLITDPRTGEVLTMVSLREDASGILSAINAPYEPGSTLKPFTVAGLLHRDLVSLRDTVDTEEGRWRVAGRTLTDVGDHPNRMTVARALQVSSNVGIAKVAAAYAPAQQYETLRDFGFGVPTGIELPGEASGTLRRPEEWSGQSPASLAIGYEVAVTPIQMAMAYGALANGGWLMEPRLIREVRTPDGTILERKTPRRIRRVIPEAVARDLRDVLVNVVEDGTGSEARLASFRVAGKSGTSRAYSRDAGYQEGGYFSSFVGFFPAEDPQLTVFVKLERPQGAYYGGSTAAPVTRATLEAILAARQAPLDRRILVTRARATIPSSSGSTSGAEDRSVARVGDGSDGEGWAESPSTGGPPAPLTLPPARFVSFRGDEAAEVASGARGSWIGGAGASASGRGAASVGAGASSSASRTSSPAVAEPVPVPDVTGLPMRVAVRRIHSLGLRVEWSDVGSARGIRPAPGSRLMPGDTVVIVGGLP